MHQILLNRHQLYIVIVVNGYGYTQGPFWLPWRIILVALENILVALENYSGCPGEYLGWPGELN